MVKHPLHDHYLDQRLLESHGWEEWPSFEQLTRHVFELEDALILLSSIAGIELRRDVRGRWVAFPLKGSEHYASTTK